MVKKIMTHAFGQTYSRHRPHNAFTGLLTENLSASSPLMQVVFSSPLTVSAA